MRAKIFLTKVGKHDCDVNLRVNLFMKTFSHVVLLKTLSFIVTETTVVCVYRGVCSMALADMVQK